jgi:hypothetical protein
MGRRQGRVFGIVILGITAGMVLGWAQDLPEISLLVTDSTGQPLDRIDRNTDDPTIGGADFLLVLRTSEATDLVTYSQQVFFDSDKVGYVGFYESGMPGGETLVNTSASEDGGAASLVISAMDVGGETGAHDLARLGFEVRESPTSGALTASDYVFTTAPYADLFSTGIAHSFADPITFVAGETPFTPTPTPSFTATATPSPTIPGPTLTPTQISTPTPTLPPTPDADFNDDGNVDERDLIILIRSMRGQAPE